VVGKRKNANEKNS
jgi:hypothetical protein